MAEKIKGAASKLDEDSPIYPLREEACLLYPELDGLTGKGDAAHWKALGSLEPAEAPHALCLSGGGIRSATFSLGILQGLAAKGRLEDFHYLSTVSGGGYIGSWLSRWRANHDWSQEKMAEATRFVDGGAAHPVRRLRSFSNYLTPNWGLSADAMTVVTLFLRNLLINLMVWLPLVLIVAAGARLLIAAVAAQPLMAVRDPIAFAALSVPAILGALWLIVMLFVFVAQPSVERDRERWSRRSGWLLLVAVGWLLWFGLFAYLPLLLLRQADAWHFSTGALGLGGGAVAVFTAAMGYWSRYGVELKRRVTGVTDAIGARILDVLAAVTLIVIALGASLAMHFAVKPFTDRPLPLLGWYYELIAHPTSGPFLRTLGSAEALWPLLAMIGGLLLFLLLVSLRVGANRFSLHALYGKRLTRAYLGSARTDRPSHGGDDYDPQDDIPMAALDGGAASGRPPSRRLFHVVNMTLNLARPGPDRRDWQERKAASFTATPLQCGSPILGYAPTAHYGGGKGMTLGRAMAISGAAASPNMGYYGSPLMALVMAFFNVRLGSWLPHPGKGIERKEPPFGLLQMLREAFSRTTDSSEWLYLSDGGHFDNLGLYEMVRRRCRRIVVIDAGCDGQFNHSDLHIAVRKIAIDFGIPIELPSTLPGQKGVGQRQRVVVGKIRYSVIDKNYPDGEIFCVKPMLTGAEPPSLVSYAATSRHGGNTFPHHSTADQFFDETQFESYRRLGEFTTSDLLDALDSRIPSEATAHSAIQAAYPLYPSDEPNEAERDAPRERMTADPPRPAGGGLSEVAAGIQEMSPFRLIITTLAAAGSVGAVTTLGSKAVDQVVESLAPGPDNGPRGDTGQTGSTDPVGTGGPVANITNTPTGDDDNGSAGGSGTDGNKTPGNQNGTGGAVGGNTSGPVDLSGIAGDIRSIRNSTDGMAKRLETLSGKGIPLDEASVRTLNDLTGRVDALLKQLGPNPLATAQAQTYAVTLREIRDQLRTLTARVDAIDPRRNVRSQ